MKWLIAITLLASGCAPAYEPVESIPVAAIGRTYSASPPPPPAPPVGKCGISDGFEARYRGRAFSPELAADLQRQTWAARLRVIRPGEAVTMDYREDRLNIELDSNGRVSAVRCG